MAVNVINTNSRYSEILDYHNVDAQGQEIDGTNGS